MCYVLLLRVCLDIRVFVHVVVVVCVCVDMCYYVCVTTNVCVFDCVYAFMMFDCVCVCDGMWL